MGIPMRTIRSSSISMRSPQRRRRVPKPMLRERGDNDRQAIAHHKGGQTRSPSGDDLKTRARPRLTDESSFGVGRPFGGLENDRGLTRVILPPYIDGALTTSRARHA